MPLSDLLALPYKGSSPFSQGLTSDDFRALVQQYGERVRWLRAVEGQTGPGGETPRPSGKFFIEQPLSDDVRVFLSRNTRDIQNADFGDLPAGQTQISFLPDEIDPTPDDRFIALDRAFTYRQKLQPSGQPHDPLHHKDIVSIDAVFAPGQQLPPSHYAIANGTNGSDGAIQWLLTLPTQPLTVIYKYRPHFEWLGDQTHQSFLGTDAKRLPGSGPLRLLSAREE